MSSAWKIWKYNFDLWIESQAGFMHIILAKTAGFCMGVRRAMQTVLDESRRDEALVYTQGPLIHNPQVIEMLKGKGIEPLGPECPAEEKSTVVIRAHGVTPETKIALEEEGYAVVDGTCPHVIRIQKIIARHLKEGFSIVVIGDHGHAEVVGLAGHAGEMGHVVANLEDVDALPEMEKVCVVSQTTQGYVHFDKLTARVKERWPDCVVYRTICGSTDKRQKETIEIARQVDLMIVVGGRNSANTVRLAELAAETGTPTQHIETSADLDLSALKGVRSVGVTAGASTPNWMIVEVTERLKDWDRRHRFFLLAGPLLFLQFLVDTNLYLAIGALGLGLGCVAMHPLATGSVSLLPLLSGSLYILAMYLFNIPTGQQADRFADPTRWRTLEKWRGAFIGAGICALLAALAISGLLGLWPFVLVLVASVSGLVYRVSALPGRLLPWLRHRRLMDIPGSKDIYAALAWATVLTLLPMLSPPLNASFFLDPRPNAWLASLVCFFFVFTLVFVRSVTFDLRDIQTDQIVGRETIPIVLGKGPTKVLLAALTGLLAIALVVAAHSTTITSAGYVMLAPLVYAWGYLYLFHRRAVAHGFAFAALVDAKFLMGGVLAWAWLIGMQ